MNRDGGIVITTVNGGVELGLVRDSVFMGLSDSVLTTARNDIARDSSDRGDSAGLGAELSGMIKRTVSSALGHRITYPVSDIERAQYAGGRIRFTYRHPKHGLTFESISTEHRKALADFNPQDAQRLVTAVDSAIAADQKRP